MHIRDIYPAKYLKGEHLEAEAYEVEISAVTVEELTAPGQEPEPKAILRFNPPVGTHKARRLVLNKTNSDTLETLLGPETDTWVGETVTLSRQSWSGKPVVRVAH